MLFGAKQLKGTQLLKLRHPNVVRILQSPLETNSAIFLETEPLMGSLANVLFHQHCPEDAQKASLEPLEVSKHQSNIYRSN